MRSYRIVFAVALLSLFISVGHSQTDCRVLKGEISLIYKGECKNGLAHGKGEASGIDNYSGEFRKGLPHGEGIYTWATGEIYEGSWKMGMRHGYGIYYFISGGRDSLLQGNWVNDRFKGTKDTDVVHVVHKQNVMRYASRRIGHGDQVIIRIMLNGVPNQDIQNLMLLSNSGTEVRNNQFISFNRVEFPFWGKITYSTRNNIMNSRFDVIFEFEIEQPGFWEIILYH